jgi:hypothetical protein
VSSIASWRERVVLREDAIEIVRAGRATVRIPLDEIVGRRARATGFAVTHVIERTRGAPVELGIPFEPDAAFEAWFASVPDLDAEELACAEAELLRAIGPTPDDARRALQGAHLAAGVLDLATLATCGWVLFVPWRASLGLSLSALLPILALLLLAAGAGRYSIDPGRNDPRAGLGRAVLLPGLALALRAMMDATVVDPSALGAGTTSIALAMGAWIALFDRHARRHWLTVPVLTLSLGAYAWGVLSHANTRLDRGRARTTEVEVTHKEVSAGQGGGPDLRLAPWGPRAAETVRVSRALYDAIDVGDSVCTELHSGALGARWFVVRACE